MMKHEFKEQTMKAVHSAEYFEKYTESLFERYKKDCDFEHDLAILLPDFSFLPEEAREKATKAVTKMNAQKVADAAKADLMKKMHTIKEIKEGRASLGYISKTQEVREWHDMVEGFEFSCFMLSKFRQKYGIE